MTLALLGDGLIALLLLVWFLFLVRLDRRLRRVNDLNAEMAKKMQDFSQTIIAGQQAARKLSEHMVRAQAQIMEEEKKIGFLIGDLQKARDDLRREIGRARQGIP